MQVKVSPLELIVALGYINPLVLEAEDHELTETIEINSNNEKDNVRKHENPDHGKLDD